MEETEVVLCCGKCGSENVNIRANSKINDSGERIIFISICSCGNCGAIGNIREEWK